MDLEIKIGCSKCKKEYFMGTQTHNYEYGDKPMVGGMCPFCNNYNTVIMEPDQIKVYNFTPEDTTVVPYKEG